MPDLARDLFDRAVLLSAADRNAFLEDQCSSDADLKRQVEQLLNAYENAGSLLEVPAINAGADPEAAMPAAQTGEQIGPYRLVNLVGDGGFGQVFKAEQIVPFQRMVALKLVKPGMGSQEAIARFESERQMLALLNHPNISRVLDAGTDRHGRPYFVMELVDGTDLVKYCDQNRLTIRSRLKLVLKICDAIRHAHQKGIIHRDLKPSNILVMEEDGAAIPVVIDFGVAKAMRPAGEPGHQTQIEQMVGTPAYASPEQFINSRDVDTRSDIYSLGVVIYELLTGTTPLADAMTSGSSYDQLRQAICEGETPRLRDAAGRDQELLPEIARNRASSSSQLLGLVTSDLEWIVMRALEKPRERRYQTINALAEDLDRYLNNDVVLARPSSRLYRLSRFVRKNRAACVSAATIFLVLAGATLFSWWQTFKAKSAYQTANELTGFMSEVLRSPDPDREGRAVTVAERLDAATKTLPGRFPGQPVREAIFWRAIGETYLGLNLSSEAIHSFDECRKLGAAMGALPDETKPLEMLMAEALLLGGETEQARALYSKLAPEMVAEFGYQHPWYVACVRGMAKCYTVKAEFAVASPILEAALDNVKTPAGRAQLSADLADVYVALSRHEDAVDLLEPIQLDEKDVAPEDVARAWNNLGYTLVSMSQFNKGMDFLEKAYQVADEHLGEEHLTTLAIRSDLAFGHFRVNERPQAIDHFQEIVRIRRGTHGADHYFTAQDEMRLGMCLMRSGQPEEALKIWQHLVDLHESKVLPPDVGGSIAVRAYNGQAGSYDAIENFDKAIESQLKGIELAESAAQPNKLLIQQARQFLARLYGRNQQHEEAIAVIQEVMDNIPPDQSGLEVPLGELTIAAHRLKAGQHHESLQEVEKTLPKLLQQQWTGRPVAVQQLANCLGDAAVQIVKSDEPSLAQLELGEKLLRKEIEIREAMITAKFENEGFANDMCSARLADCLVRQAALLTNLEFAEKKVSESRERLESALNSIVENRDLYRRQRYVKADHVKSVAEIAARFELEYAEADGSWNEQILQIRELAAQIETERKARN